LRTTVVKDSSKEDIKLNRGQGFNGQGQDIGALRGIFSIYLI
jgi:hypothetical protein